MDDVGINIHFVGWDSQYKGWRYDFHITTGSYQIVQPFLISDQCPEESREQQAIMNFRDWVAKVAAEAAKL